MGRNFIPEKRHLYFSCHHIQKGIMGNPASNPKDTDREVPFPRQIDLSMMSLYSSSCGAKVKNESVSAFMLPSLTGLEICSYG